MSKVKSIWCCEGCGHKQAKWAGQCPTCSEWNTLHEEVDIAPSQRRFESQPQASAPVRLKEVKSQEAPRIQSGVNELDRLLGGGIVPGSLTLIGGEPGIGKSTLMLQLSQALAKQGLTVLYVCGEESVEQTSLRSERLGIDAEGIYLLSETHFSAIKKQVDAIQPDLLIVDSIQIVYKNELNSAPGSVSQVRETTSEFMHLAKGHNIATLLVGHVTKSGEIAGPKILEHLVDTVLYFEGDKQQQYRMVRVVKNRFGPTDEIAVFQMQGVGLIEVPNPSKIFLEEREKNSVGSVVIPTLEGTRPILVEVQALVTETAFSTPARKCTGIDTNRLALLLAVLEKRLGYPMHRCDVFVSVAGGVRVQEPAADLGIMIAVASSLRNCRVDPQTIVVGEVGLGGEVRSVSRLDGRMKEAQQMGFKKAIVPRYNIQHTAESLLQKELQYHPVEVVDQAIKAVLS